MAGSAIRQQTPTASTGWTQVPTTPQREGSPSTPPRTGGRNGHCDWRCQESCGDYEWSQR
eukprot:328179-Chlamydomonas_euryale.AAC.1